MNREDSDIKENRADMVQFVSKGGFVFVFQYPYSVARCLMLGRLIAISIFKKEGRKEEDREGRRQGGKEEVKSKKKYQV